jgi:hypothetical protein
MFLFIFKINQSDNSHDENSQHYYDKTVHFQSSFNSHIAPSVVSKYFTRSKSRFATFSFFMKYLSFMDKFNHTVVALSRK